MTDITHQLTVDLDADTQIEDVIPIVEAIRQIPHVADVCLHKVTIATLAGTIRAQQKFRKSFESYGTCQENPQTKNGTKANQE